MDPSQALRKINKEIVACERCPRLVKYRAQVAKEKRRAYRNDEYWGKPIPGFGDPNARLLIIGLAPAAHGANRTGRVFTGDRSGEWLYRALHKAGFANQPCSNHRDDSLTLHDAYIACSLRCAPPANKPLPIELSRCASYLDRELEVFRDVKVYLALGQIALNSVWPHLVKKFEKEAPRLRKPKFAHGGKYEIVPGKWLLFSYHPSQQNTFTGRLTEPMFDSVFREASKLIEAAKP
ncbi:MAG: uracil-DNA glycosylase [Oligoflexia bacterium]|nr:uracil-DNA glycosylase [Oligoflexia bacterium]